MPVARLWHPHCKYRASVSPLAGALKNKTEQIPGLSGNFSPGLWGSFPKVLSYGVGSMGSALGALWEVWGQGSY